VKTGRWFFYSRSSRSFAFTLEGDPTHHPGWVKWQNVYRNDGSFRHRLAVIRISGLEYYGQRGTGVVSDLVVCNRGCETAKNPDCVCSCGGKNHGIHHSIQKEDGPSFPSGEGWTYMPLQGEEIP
jgi:hypothetical protein